MSDDRQKAAPAGKIEVAINSKDGSVALKITGSRDGRSEVSYQRLDADELDIFIRQLATARAGLLPAQPMERPLSKATGTLGPAVDVSIEPLRNLVVLSIRHQGFGWLNFLFPPDAARLLGQGLDESGKELAEKQPAQRAH